MFGDIVAGFENGFVIPEAGRDKAWIKEHYEEFQKLAEQGDEGMARLVEEVKGRGLLEE